MLDACTRCGKCVEVCPSVKPAGISDAKPEDIISGVLELVRTGAGPEASRKWAASCMLSGECIKACDYGVNPRFLLAMARLGMAKADKELPERRRQGVENTARWAAGCDGALAPAARWRGARAARQKSASVAKPAAAPDFVFYTGCNVLKTPHIALLALDIMDALGVSLPGDGRAEPLLRHPAAQPGDVEMSGRMGSSTIEKLSHSKSGQVIPGARAATSSSPKRRCRRWSGSAARGRSR